MSLGHGLKIQYNDLKFLLDFKSPRCYSGSGTTVNNRLNTRNSEVVTGSLINSPTYDSSGFFSFNGTNQKINVNNGWTEDSNRHQITMSFRTTTTSVRYMFALNSDGTYPFTDHCIIRSESDGKVRCSFLCGTGSGTDLVTTSALNDGNWHIITFVRDGHNIGRVYVDGRLDVADTDNSGSFFGVNWVNGTVSIASDDSNNNHWAGDIGFVMFHEGYSTGLPAADAQQIFNSYRGRYGI